MANIVAIKDLDEMCVIKWRLTDVCNYHCSYCIREPLADKDSALQYDWMDCISAIDDIIRIARELYEINNMKVKVDLIGGEISLFNGLYMLLGILYNSEYITKINITTNLSRDIDYYLQLCECAEIHNKKLSMTASYHFQFANLDKFMEKAKLLYEKLGDGFKCETVITNGNNDIPEFINYCNKIGCHYMCEEDMKDPSKKGLTVKNYKVGNRYKVTLDDGKEILYTTRNEVCKTYGNQGVAINTTNMVCTRDNNYVYIEKDYAIPCRMRCPIANYRVSPKPQLCKHGQCSLCGHMSIKKNENPFKIYDV